MLHILPSLLKPTGRPQRSVLDAINSFVAYFKDAKDLDNSDNPRIVLIGPTIFDINQVAVNFQNLNYICENSLQALDIVFRCYWIFDKSYPTAANNVFIFIQQFFYGIQLQSQISSPSVKKLVKILQNIANHE